MEQLTWPRQIPGHRRRIDNIDSNGRALRHHPTLVPLAVQLRGWLDGAYESDQIAQWIPSTAAIDNDHDDRRSPSPLGIDATEAGERRDRSRLERDTQCSTGQVEKTGGGLARCLSRRRHPGGAERDGQLVRPGRSVQHRAGRGQGRGKGQTERHARVLVSETRSRRQSEAARARRTGQGGSSTCHWLISGSLSYERRRSLGSHQPGGYLKSGRPSRGRCNPRDSYSDKSRLACLEANDEPPFCQQSYWQMGNIILAPSSIFQSRRNKSQYFVTSTRSFVQKRDESTLSKPPPPPLPYITSSQTAMKIVMPG